MVTNVLANVPPNFFQRDSHKFAHNQFNTLILFTVRVFFSLGQQNQAFASLGEAIINSLSQAMTKNPALKILKRYQDEIRQIFSTKSNPTRLRMEWETKVNALADDVGTMMNAIQRPTLDDVAILAACLNNILANTTSLEFAHGMRIERLANGQFGKLLRNCVGIFGRRLHNPEFLSVLQNVMTMLEQASERDQRFHSLLNFRDNLLDIKQKMEGHQTSRTQTFDSDKWNRDLQSLESRLAQLIDQEGAPLADLRDFIDEYCKMLQTAVTVSFKDAKNITSTTFLEVVETTSKLFYRSEIDKSHKHFQGLCPSIQELKAVQPLIEARPEPPKTKADIAFDAFVIRLESLVSKADNLLTVPVTERQDRVSKFVNVLRCELRGTFPPSKKRPERPRAVMKVVADTIDKAMQLIQHDPVDKNASPHMSYINIFTPRNQSNQKNPNLCQTIVTAEEDALREQLTTVHRRIQSWDNSVFSLKEFDVMRVIQSIMAHSCPTWHVQTDRTVADCLKLLTLRALAIKKKDIVTDD